MADGASECFRPSGETWERARDKDAVCLPVEAERIYLILQPDENPVGSIHFHSIFA